MELFLIYGQFVKVGFLKSVNFFFKTSQLVLLFMLLSEQKFFINIF